MKKATSLVTIIVLFIISILGITNIFEKKQEQKQMDQLFRSCVVMANEALLNNYTSLDEATKTDYYIKVSSNLYTALNIINFTSYNGNKENRNKLFSGIYNLYLCMTSPENREEIVTTRLEIVRELLTKISIDPNNGEASEELAKLAGELFFKRN